MMKVEGGRSVQMGTQVSAGRFWFAWSGVALLKVLKA